MRCCRSAPGSYPDTFDQRLRNGRCTPGEIGQFVTADYPLTYAERLAAACEALSSYCVFDLEDGDPVGGGIVTPRVGPPLTIVGSPVTGESTPWVDRDGAPVTCGMRGPSDYLITTAPPQAADDQDIVLVSLAWHDGIVANSYAFHMYDTAPARGFGVNLGRTDQGAYLWGSGGVIGPIAAATNTPGWRVYGITVRRGGTANCYMNGLTGAPVDVSALGSLIGATTELRLGGSVSGSRNVRVVRTMLFYGAGIGTLADTAWHTRVARRVLGMLSSIGGAATFVRATASAWAGAGGTWGIASAGMPRAGDGIGELLEPARTNKVYNNVNPSATTGWSATGGTVSVVSDAAALATAKMDVWGPNVHRFVPGAGDQVVYGGAVTGSTAPHSISVFLRGAAGGESVDIGLRDSSSGAFQVASTVVLTTSWALYQVDGVTPADTDQQFGLDCDAGDTIYHVGDTFEAGVVSTTPIPNWATAATAARNQDVLTLGETPVDAQGSIELTVTPQGWGAAEAGTVGLITRVTGAPPILTVTSGTWQLQLDGTTTLDSGVAPADGTAQTIRLRWAGGVMSIDVNGTRVSGAYDGSVQGSGAWQIAAGATVRVRDVRCYRNGGG